MSYAVEVHHLEDIDNILLSGEVSLTTWTQVWHELGRQLLCGRRHIAINIDGLEYLDGLGLKLLSKARHLIERRGGSLAVICTDAQRRRVLHVAGLDQYVSVLSNDSWLANRLMLEAVAWGG
ncbi:MAG TPA: STAS domain-containing protein [Candidatus Xenobia bacterium]|jgi:anti-anti-sigma factor